MLVVIALIVVAILWAGSGAQGEEFVAMNAFAYGRDANCESPELVHGFGLSDLPSARPVPESGDLPLGPKTVRFSTFPGRVVPIGESIRYDLSSQNYYGRTPLKWTVRGRMLAVTGQGRVKGEVDREEIHVRTISASDEFELLLEPASEPGYYRADITLLDEDGKKLVAYREYLKVFDRRYIKLRLGLNARTVRPGERVASRLENLGTETVNYGSKFHVQRYEGGEWVAAREVAGDVVWPLWLGYLAPGAHGRCNYLRIPRDAPPGSYRIVKEVGPSPWPNGDRRFFLTAPFAVVD